MVFLCSWCHPASGRFRIRSLNNDYERKVYGICSPEEGCGRSGTVYSKEKVKK